MIRHLRAADPIAAFAAIALVVLMWGRWFGAQSAWQAFYAIDVLLVLCALPALALVYAQGTRRNPALPILCSVTSSLGGLLATIAIAIRLIVAPVEGAIGGAAWAALAAAAVLWIASWRSMRDEAMPGWTQPEPELVSAPGAGATGSAARG